MNRKMGMESQFGIGGGSVSAESTKNLEIAEDLCRRRKPKKAMPYLTKALEDGNNLDACIQCAFLMDMPSALDCLELAEMKGRLALTRTLGPKCFEADGDNGGYVGHFWMLLETRPYMRVRQAQVRLYFESKKYNKSAATIIDMLRLCPGDNMGQRAWLGSVLLQCMPSRARDALSFAQAWFEPHTVATGDPPPLGGCAFGAPSQNLLPKKQEQEMSKWGDGAMVYSAALAAFKTFGDGELARQYLRIAAKLNPIVLTKILARIEQPKSLNMSPRGMNGPEAAQDYLWLTQNLWMEPDVWAWANSIADAKAAVLRPCQRPGCGKTEDTVAQFKRCASCKEAWYCGATCQKDDWARHKKACKDKKQYQAMMKAITAGKPLPSNSIPVASMDMNGITMRS